MSLGLITHHRLMADYNQWMNTRLIALLLDTPDEDLRQDRGAYFGSIMGTFNHIYVADIIWMRRLAVHPASNILDSLSGFEAPARLDEVVYDNLSDFAPVRARLDDLMIRYIDSLSEADLATPLSYRRVNGEAHTKLLGLVLSHVFNHQTHHRGQLTTLISQMGVDIGVTDLLVRVPAHEI